MLNRPKTPQTLDPRMLTRRCVGCGYDGALLRGGAASRCARCGCDLRQRPARSYAEMEDLLDQSLTIESPYSCGSSSDIDCLLRSGRLDAYSAKGRPDNMTHHWLAFTFMAMLGFCAILLLMAAVLNSVSI